MTIQSIQRALDILSLFSRARPAYRLTDIAKRLNLSTSTVHGIVSTLEQNGMLINDPRTRQYKLGPKVCELGSHYASSLQINIHSSNPAQRLAQRTNLSSLVGIWDKNSALITLFAVPQNTWSTAYNFGPRVIPYCTAVGKAILAYIDREVCMAYLTQEQLIRHTKYTLATIEEILDELDEIRERGYAINKGEYMLGRTGVAAPIWGPEESLEGAMVITGRAEDEILGDKLSMLAEELLQTCSQISEAMGSALGGPAQKRQLKAPTLKGT